MFSKKVEQLRQRRKTAGPLPIDISPVVTSSFFRTDGSNDRNSRCTMSRTWDHRLSNESRQRHAATLKASTKSTLAKSPINLGVARPNAENSPWRSLVTHCQNTVRFDEHELGDPYQSAMSCERGEQAYDLGIAMNYGYAAGSPQVLRFMSEHVEIIHDPPYRDWECCLTCGSTSALDILLRMLCNRGDSILVESFTYAGAIEAARPLGLTAVGVDMDFCGLRPEALDATLQGWHSRHGPKPFVLYTVPSGHNPTGRTQPLARRRAIYEVAEKHDLIIIEDDPYYFLHLGSSWQSKASGFFVSTDDYLQSLPPSYLSMDKSGRVLRLDSTSKILAPGLRCGWLSGCAQLVAQFLHQTELSTVSPSGPSQVLLYKLLDETWGHHGFVEWLQELSSTYRQCRNIMIDACDRYIPSRFCSWEVPEIGMFVWFHVDLTQHPLAEAAKSPQYRSLAREVEESIFEAAKANGVQISKGSWFAADDRSDKTTVRFRLTFAAASRHQLGEGVRHFGEALESQYQPRNRGDIPNMGRWGIE